ncbi:MAG: hypothetical protein ACD_73C00798G0006 [uncultured bacterium]|nr:MAG: hypothetical protein ACD_73C00798G0006 [uncultured bacterium]
MKVLIVEDDKDIAELIDYNLKKEKFETQIVASGSKAVHSAVRFLPDLIILDLMLPEVDGLEICRNLKAEARTKAIPVIMLTAKGEEVDRIVGLEMGAEDYLAKPFSPRELVLRVKAIIRRVKGSGEGNPKKILTVGDIVIDPERFQVFINKKEVKLTAIEFKLLQYLVSTRGRVATRDSLLDHVWGYESALTTRTVDTHVKRLRFKMGMAGELIETIRGIGYRFKE